MSTSPQNNNSNSNSATSSASATNSPVPTPQSAPGSNQTPQPVAGASAQQPSSTAPKASSAPVSMPAMSAQNPAQSTTPSNPNFTTGNIGRWASRQENPFAEQNRKADAEKQKRDRQRRKIAPYLYIGGGIIVLALIIWGIVALISHRGENTPVEGPIEIAGSSEQDIADYQQILQNFLSQQQGTTQEKEEGVNKLVQNTLNTANGQDNANAVKLAQLGAFVASGMYDAGLVASKEIDPESLDIKQLATYYNLVYLCYLSLGNQEKAAEYLSLMYEASYKAEEQRIEQEKNNE